MESLHTIAESLPGLLGNGTDSPGSRNADGSARSGTLAQISPEQEAANALVRIGYV